MLGAEVEVMLKVKYVTRDRAGCKFLRKTEIKSVSAIEVEPMLRLKDTHN